MANGWTAWAAVPLPAAVRRAIRIPLTLVGQASAGALRGIRQYKDAFAARFNERRAATQAYEAIATPYGRKRRLDFDDLPTLTDRPAKRRATLALADVPGIPEVPEGPDSPLTPKELRWAWTNKLENHDPKKSKSPSPIRWKKGKVYKPGRYPGIRHHQKYMRHRAKEVRRLVAVAESSEDAARILELAALAEEDPDNPIGFENIRSRKQCWLDVKAKRHADEDEAKQAEIDKAEALERYNQQRLKEEKKRIDEAARIKAKKQKVKDQRDSERRKQAIVDYEKALQDYIQCTESLGDKFRHVHLDEKPQAHIPEIVSRRDKYGRILKEEPAPERKRILAPLTDDWEEKVEAAIRVRGDATIMGKSVEGVELSRRDIARLWPGEPWLNDEVVNAWYAALCARLNEKDGYVKGPNNVPRWVAYSTAWFKTATGRGMQSIAGWSRRKGVKGDKLLQAERIFFPTNSGAHWTLLAISGTNRTIEYLDSMNTSGHALAKYTDLARAWLRMELGDDYHAEEWTVLKTSSGQQDNTNDCGVFACLNGLGLSKSCPDLAAEFGAGEMPLARRLFVAVLLNGGFTGDFDL